MQEITNQEARALAAAGDLLQQVRRGVRVLDVFSKAVAAYTHDERIRKAWETLDREFNRLGYADDPHLYCQACKGEGETADAAGHLTACVTCDGHRFFGQQAPAFAFHLPGSDRYPLTF